MESNKMILVADVLKAISDKRSLELFGTVALTKPDTEILISKTKLTRKQYYSRMSSLMNAGLIKRKNGKHTLTAFGKVIYDISLATVENAVSNYWKLKAIDSLQMSNDIPAEERKKLIYNLIDNDKIKTILDPDNRPDSHPYGDAMQQQRQKYSGQMKAELLIH
jgi:predicted transcriptional regulator